MITFKQFLNEDKQLYELNDDTLKLVKSKCKKFLENLPDDFLYRGTKTRNKEGIVYYPQPTNRIPKDSSPEYNNQNNLFFREAFGIENLRNTSYFGVRDERDTNQYGELNLLLPAGDYKFVVGKETMTDLYADRRKLAYKIIVNLTKKYKQLETDHSFSHGILEILRHADLNFTNMNLNDIEELLKTYVEQTPQNINFLELKKDILFAAAEVIKQEFYNGDDLEVKTQYRSSEFMFYQGDGYFLVTPDAMRLALLERNLNVGYELHGLVYNFINLIKNS